jgi:putative restriction endonuclease
VANAIFITKPAPTYDDTPEVRYHFPQRYLKRVEQTVNDWIIYYEPRRANDNESNRDGRQVYFAMAKVSRVERDPARSDHYYAYISNYLEFAQPVPFRMNGKLLESSVQKPDGSINPGNIINAIRLMPQADFEMICRLGMAPAILDSGVAKISDWEELAVAETQAEYGKPRETIATSRTVRDAAFTRVVRDAYNKTCAMTGLQLVNGGGRCEIEAAHIRAVENEGPDSPRNGIALSRTVHWMFDRGILSIEDNGRILMAKGLVPDQVRRMINPDGHIIMPANSTFAPHKTFLRYHREHRYKGN